jgi:hypothetical protein
MKTAFRNILIVLALIATPFVIYLLYGIITLAIFFGTLGAVQLYKSNCILQSKYYEPEFIRDTITISQYYTEKYDIPVSITFGERDSVAIEWLSDPFLVDFYKVPQTDTLYIISHGADIKETFGRLKDISSQNHMDGNYPVFSYGSLMNIRVFFPNPVDSLSSDKDKRVERQAHCVSERRIKVKRE